MDSANDQLLTAALAAKGLATAQQALAEAQKALARAEPVPLDVAALVSSIVQAVARVKIPAPSVKVSAADAPQITVAAPTVNVEAAAAPNVTVSPNIIVDVPAFTAPVVNVEAPSVNIEPAIVNVAAPNVRVDVPPAPPVRPWRMVVVRNTRTQLIESADIYPVEEAA